MALTLAGTYRAPTGWATVALYTDDEPSVYGFLFFPDGIHPSLRQSLSLQELFEWEGGWLTPVHAGLAFITDPTADNLASASSFAGALEVALKGLRSGWLHLNHGGLILWLQQIGAFQLADVAAIRMLHTSSGWVVADDSPSVIASDAVLPLVLLPESKAAPATVSGSTLMVGSSQAPVLVGTPTGADDQMVSPAFAPLTLMIDVESGTPGQISFTAGSAEGFPSLRIGFMYSLVPMPTLGPPQNLTTSTLFYPLFDPAPLTPGDTFTVTATINPGSGAGQVSGSLAMQSSAPAITSAFRTTLGEALTLTPVDGLVFQSVPCGDGSLYFTPVGSFTTPDVPATLLCGLSGLETIALPASTCLTFALASGGVWGTSAGGQTGYSFPPSNSILFETAWASVSTGASYSVQSPHAPLFVPVVGSSLLEPATLSSAAVSASASFPLVPYGGIRAMASGPGTTLQGFSAFEANCLAPTREGIILGDTPALPSITNGTALAVTPQGFVATTSSGGTVTSLQLGTVGSATLSFTGGILDDVMQGLTAAQPFLVITSFQNGSGAFSGTTVSVDGWSFDLGMPSGPFTGTLYTTVMIVKAAGAPLSQLVATPSAWTSYSRFNDTTYDPAGLSLSSYLVNYLQQARQLYADGTGDPDFQAFVDLIDDPDWSGVLYLSPAVDLDSCDPSLQPLLVGVDGSTFYAHHLAIAGNTVTITGTSSFTQSSVMSGLVYYVRPGTTPSQLATGSAGYVTSNTVYDFQVLLLRAVFLNSTMTAFQSSAQLIVGALFGDQVTTTPVGGGVLGSNIIPLVGTAHVGSDGNGQATYALNVPAEYIGVFYLNSAAINQFTLDKVTTALQEVQSGADTLTQLVFNLSGWMGLRSNPGGLDLLSYDTIAVGGISLTMTFETNGEPQTPVFAYDDSAAMAAPLQEVQTPSGQSPILGSPGYTWYRPGSFVSGMPMAINKFLSVQTGQSPSDLGFQSVTLPDAADITFSSPWYGLILDLDMGDNGTAGSSALITAQILIAWAPNGSSASPPSVALFFGVQGPDGLALDLSIEGVLTLGAKSVSLLVSQGAYMLVLESIGLTVLSKTFPGGGLTNLYLAGFLDQHNNRALGWFGGYAEPAGSR